MGKLLISIGVFLIIILCVAQRKKFYNFARKNPLHRFILISSTICSLISFLAIPIFFFLSEKDYMIDEQIFLLWFLIFGCGIMGMHLESDNPISKEIISMVFLGVFTAFIKKQETREKIANSIIVIFYVIFVILLITFVSTCDWESIFL